MGSPTFNLVVFFTRRTSLQRWQDLGILERELAIYRRLRSYGASIALVTYGGRGDELLARGLPEFTVCANRWGLPRRAYEHAIPWIHRRILEQANLVKTNQTNGAEIALRAARLTQKRLVARCGFMWSATELRNHGRDSKQYRTACREEEIVFPAADRIVVTTTAMKHDLERRIPITEGRVEIIPNYVDTTQFRPNTTIEKKFDVVFVGRLSPEKNFKALAEAVRDTSLRLLVIGGGQRQSDAAKQFPWLAEQTVWIPRVPHTELPRYLQQGRIFAMPSIYEGHPKALIEAMACGLTVLGSNVTGVRDVIVHGQTGWLCKNSADELRANLNWLHSHPSLCELMGRAARKQAVAEFSLDALSRREFEMLSEVAAQRATMRIRAA